MKYNSPGKSWACEFFNESNKMRLPAPVSLFISRAYTYVSYHPLLPWLFWYTQNFLSFLHAFRYATLLWGGLALDGEPTRLFRFSQEMGNQGDVCFSSANYSSMHTHTTNRRQQQLEKVFKKVNKQI